MKAHATTPNAGIVFYDGECVFCTGWARRLERVVARRGFELATLQSQPQRGLMEMQLQLADGRELGGADALVEIARHIWWSWPLFALGKIPGVMPLLRASYRKFAANRHCLNGVCGLNHHTPHQHRHSAFFELP